MILNNNTINIKQEGEILDNIKMEFDVENIGFLQKMVSKFYSFARESSIRENISNSIDSITETGKNTPAIAKLYKEGDIWYFAAIDEGIGINQETINNIISKYGKSTKRNDNKLYGMYGLGCKSFFAYTDHFFIIGIKDGIEAKWMIHEGEKENEITKLYEIPTDKPNGATFYVQLKNQWDEPKKWSKALREQLCYFKNVYIQDEYNPIDQNYKIYESDLFKYSEISSDNLMHICFEDVYYPINFSKLDISPIYLGIGLKFSMDSGIVPLPNRETLYYTDEVKQIILKKIKEVSNWFVTQFNNQNRKPVNTWKEAREILRQTNKIVKLNEIELNINSIIKYSDISIENLQIKTYNAKYIQHLHAKEYKILDILECIATYDFSNRLKSKNLNELFSFKNNCILTDYIPVGNLREYLKETEYKYFFKLKQIKLKGKFSWYNILNLEQFPKNEWRELIQNAWNIVQEGINSCTKIENIKIPQDWLDNRKKIRQYQGKVLNKQQGEITIGFCSEKHNKNGYTFKKETRSIDSLIDNKYLTIYDHEEKGKLIELHKWFKKSNKRHEVAIIGLREANKIKNNDKFIKLQDFMNIKLFRKYATAKKAIEVNNILEKLFKNQDFDTIITILSDKFRKDYEEFNKYIEENDYSISEEFQNELLKYAEENNYYDFEMLEHINKISNIVEQYSFLQYLKIPKQDYYESTENYQERIKPFKKIMHQILLFNKLNKGMFEDWTMCPPAKVLEPQKSTI